MKKKLSILLASVLIISSTATSFGASFADINDVPWAGAETYINAASSLGLMAGEESNGQTIFRAKDSVTLYETAQLVYNLLKETGNATVSNDVISKWTEVMSDSNIPSWAQTAVAYCLENSIVSTSSVSGFMASDGKSKEASREDVAVMLGKALCLVDSSLSLGSTSTKFKDNTKISSSAVQYITLLSNKHILSGDNNGNFNPKKTINRTEMAVLITKSYTVIEQRLAEVLPAEGTAHAFVSEISGGDGSVKVTFFNGMPSKSYTIDSTVPVSYEDGKAASYTDIAKGQLLTISYNGDCITKVVIGGNATGDLLTSGVICDVSDEKNEIELHNCHQIYDFNMNDGVNITLDGKAVDVEELIDAMDDLEDNYDVDEEFEAILYADITMDDDNNVTDIKVSTRREAWGSISNITKNEIGLGTCDVGEYRFKDTSVNVILDDTVVGIDDLADVVEKGKDVTAYLILDNDDDVIEIQAFARDRLKGTILYVTANKIMLTDGRYYYFDADYEDDVYVDLNHGTTIDDLINTVNDGNKIYVELTIDSHDYITDILDITGFEKTILNITKSKIELSDGSSYNIDVAHDVHVIFDDADDLNVDADVDDLIDAVSDGHRIYVYITRDSEGLEIEATTWGPVQLKFLHLERESEKHDK